MSPEEMVKKAEERLKNAQRDLREAKEKEQKEQKVTMRKGGKAEPVAPAAPPVAVVSSLGRTKGREASSSLRATSDSAGTPTRSPAGSMNAGTSPASPSRPLSFSTATTTSLDSSSGAIDKPASPPRPRREAPTLQKRVPDLPPLPITHETGDK